MKFEGTITSVKNVEGENRYHEHYKGASCLLVSPAVGGEPRQAVQFYQPADQNGNINIQVGDRGTVDVFVDIREYTDRNNQQRVTNDVKDVRNWQCLQEAPI